MFGEKWIFKLFIVLKVLVVLVIFIIDFVYGLGILIVFDESWIILLVLLFFLMIICVICEVFICGELFGVVWYKNWWKWIRIIVFIDSYYKL